MCLLIKRGKVRALRADMVNVREEKGRFGITSHLTPTPELLAILERINARDKAMHEHLAGKGLALTSFSPIAMRERAGEPSTCRYCGADMYSWGDAGRTISGGWRSSPEPTICSAECEAAEARDYQRRYRKTYDRPSRAKGPEQRTCEHCGQPFTAKRTDARYCSATCRQRAKRARLSGCA